MFEYLIYKEIILEEYGHALKTYLVEERHFFLMSVYQGSGNMLPWSSDHSVPFSLLTNLSGCSILG